MKPKNGSIRLEASGKAIHDKFYNEEDHSYADKSMSNLAATLYGNVMPRICVKP